MFYTNVFARGDKIYLRGYEGDRRVNKVIDYKPYLFIPARKESKTHYKTLDNKPVEKLDFDSISEAKDFLKRYDDVHNMSVYGLTDFKYLYIHDSFPGEIKYNVERINIIGIDIETNTGNKYEAVPGKKVLVRKKQKNK